MKRISRKDKKKLKSLLLCLTGNPVIREHTCNKQEWISLKKKFIKWFRLFSLEERTIANTVKYKNIENGRRNK